jgi:hypothetical protein
LKIRRSFLGNPRAGLVGAVVLPYIVVFEGLGPLLEMSGYAVTAAAAAGGFVE